MNEFSKYLEKHVVDYHDFVLDLEIMRDLSNEYLDDFEFELIKNKNYASIKGDYLIIRELNILIHILDRIPNKEIKTMTKDEVFFYPLCNKTEISRIFNLKSSHDYLLKYRAEQIIDNQRLHRVFIKLRKAKKDWDFDDYFDTIDFHDYLDLLPAEQRALIENIAFGTIYLKEANGYCMATEFGNIVVVSFTLNHFLYYMNLFYFGEQLGVSKVDCFAALQIAIRILLGTETLDFEIDTRGELPVNVDKVLNFETKKQIDFIIGHEFAHHYLGHLSSGDITLLKSFQGSIQNETKFYNYSESKELDADYHSIMTPKFFDDDERSDIANGAFNFFLYLDLIESVLDYIRPRSSYESRTHPLPIDRLNELRKRIPNDIGVSLEVLNQNLEQNELIKKSLIKDFLPFNIDGLEEYGSIYLPNYKGEKIHDKLL